MIMIEKNMVDVINCHYAKRKKEQGSKVSFDIYLECDDYCSFDDTGADIADIDEINVVVDGMYLCTMKSLKDMIVRLELLKDQFESDVLNELYHKGVDVISERRTK